MSKFLKNKIDPYIIDVIGRLRSAAFILGLSLNL